MDSYEWNKVLAAILTALLVVLGLRYFGDNVLFGGHGVKYKDFAVSVDLPEAGAGGAKEEEKPLDLGTLLAAASVEAGSRSAKKCAACHNFEQGGPNLTGPNLWGLVGRDIGSKDGFRYSAALQGIGGAWTYENLYSFVENPQTLANGSAMVLKIRKPEERANIIAYLASLTPDAPPFPAPVVIEETSETIDETPLDAE
ncbi:MAG: c-type cytochrome [Pseudomonadota bacterium]